MVQAYARIGHSTDMTRESLVRFADEVSSALGAFDKATEMFRRFTQYVYGAGQMALEGRDAAANAARAAFTTIGQSFEDFAGPDGLQRFRTAFDAALPNLSAQDVANWIRAGVALGEFNDAANEIENTLREITHQQLRGQSWRLAVNCTPTLSSRSRTG